MSSPTAPVVIVSVYGDYGRWLGPFLESALATGHRNFIIVSDGAQRASAEDLVKWAFEGSNVQVGLVEDEPDFPAMLADPKLKGFAFLAAWRRAYRILQPGQRFACVQVDTILQRNLEAAWIDAKPSPFGLAAPVTRRSGRSLFTPVALFGTAARIVDAEMANLLRESVRLCNANNREHISFVYGNFISAALAMLASRAEEGMGTIIGQLPESWSGVDDQAAIVHFAGVEPSPETILGKRWRELGEEYSARKEGVTS